MRELATQQYLILLGMPLAGAAIGWFTNFLAVKMLLRPLHPIKLLGMTFQGLLPRRHKELANRISSTIAKDFLTKENILDFINKSDNEEILRDYIRRKWDEKIDDILGYIPIAQMFLSGNQLNAWRERIAEAFGGNAEEITQFIVEALTQKVDLEAAIKQNILEFDLERLEAIIEEIASKEFRYIERLGGIIGFIIGLVQALLVVFFF